MKTRFSAAAKAASWHLLLSLLVALVAGGLVFGLWFPAPLHLLAGGGGLFLILTAVDVVCGPLLTLVLFNPEKPRRKWWVDVALIACVQLGALVYGLSQVALARPVFISAEGDRFRVVQAMDVKAADLEQAAAEFRQLGWTGPRLIGSRLSQPGDADYLASVQLSVQGLHPSFRPQRWIPYESAVPGVLQRLQPLSALREKNAGRVDVLDAALLQHGLKDDAVGYLPLVREEITDWVTLVRRSDGVPVAHLPLDGW